MTRYLPAVAVFLGSFLLFGVQPMMGRTLLPSFGGSAAVWTVCLAAYQTLLLLGYFYAHLMAKRNLRVQFVVHALLLSLSVVWTAAFVYYRPTANLFPGHGPTPALGVLFCVLLFAGLPYVLLSAGSSLVQAWLSANDNSSAAAPTNVYKLYAVSNLGSFFGLLAYPSVFEPLVSLSIQWWGFTGCLAIYTLFITAVGVSLAPRVLVVSKGGPELSKATHFSTGKSQGVSQVTSQWLWFVLPCLSVFLLNAVTTHLTQDVMSLPLLWVVLLAAFLLSYVVGFSGRVPWWSGWLELGSLICVFVLALTMKSTGGARVFLPNLLAGVGLVAFGCTLLHGWLYRIRPQSSLLTKFYLLNALGGAVGGIAVSFLAPLSFKGVAEYPLAVFLVLLFAALSRWTTGGEAGGDHYFLPRWIYAPVLVCVLGISGYQTVFENTKGRSILLKERSFYGTITITEVAAATGGGTKGVLREFVHGSTVHGVQARIEGKERMTTAYYTPDAGGVAILQHPNYKRQLPMRVGLVGMGIGVMLGYSRPCDTYICYEINEQVVNIATNSNMFSFIDRAQGRVDLRMGDARQILTVEAANKEPLYDVLVLDALTGDNIPSHLCTKEAFKMYLDRLSPDGILAINISNWHLDLLPLIKAVSDEFEIPAMAFSQGDDFSKLRFTSMWALMMRKPPKDFSFPGDAKILPLQQAKQFRLPSDERGSFISLIRW